jgi:hypothetical protein
MERYDEISFDTDLDDDQTGIDRFYFFISEIKI